MHQQLAPELDRDPFNGIARLSRDQSNTLSPDLGARVRACRWITQTILHSDTTTGNCMQAAVASLFGLPLSEVPHFAADGDRAHLGLMNFAQSYGFDLTCEPHAKSREGLYLACGPTERGTSHMVVYRDGNLWHDPHPSRAGLTSVDFVYIIEPLDPAIHVAGLVAAKRIAPLMAKASTGPWESDTSDTEDGRGPYKARQMLNAEGKCIFETSNSDVQCVTEEHSENGCYAWDEQAEADLAYIEAMDTFARALAILTEPRLPSTPALPHGEA